MIRLEDTNGNAVAAAISAERHRMGSPATGMVLTLLILADEETQADATSAAVSAAREHPMRILTVIPRPGRGGHRLDAEVSVGGDDGPGEVAVLRLRGPLAEHAGSVCIPLLLSDTPVVAWWPGRAPDVPGDDPIGMHAQRRITDMAAGPRPLTVMAMRQAGYQPGDTDLAWTRLTPWRTVLAAMLDQPHQPVTSAEVSVERSNPSGTLLVAWLATRLAVPVTLRSSRGPGVTAVRLRTEAGDLAVHRPDGSVAALKAPGQPDATIALTRRDLPELLSEELRRLDPDEVFAETLAAVTLPTPRPARPAGRHGASGASG